MRRARTVAGLVERQEEAGSDDGLPLTACGIHRREGGSDGEPRAGDIVRERKCVIPFPPVAGVHRDPAPEPARRPRSAPRSVGSIRAPSTRRSRSTLRLAMNNGRAGREAPSPGLDADM
eukprot:1178761-Prorocentrum_minimum.AAC.3